MLTLDKFEEASEKVKEVTLETKLIYSNYLSEQTGNKVYLKPENMQFTGAYKVRGAYYKISTLSEEERERGLITASAGNHAQGVAYAAKCYGCKLIWSPKLLLLLFHLLLQIYLMLTFCLSFFSRIFLYIKQCIYKLPGIKFL